MEKEKEEFKPFVPAEKEMKEFSITAVIVGVLLAVVFGAANAYLGLRVGMTVSASIPAALPNVGPSQSSICHEGSANGVGIFPAGIRLAKFDGSCANVIASSAVI